MKAGRVALLLAAAAVLEFFVGRSPYRRFLPVDWFLLATAVVARSGDFVRAVLTGAAAGALAADGIRCRLLHCHTVKPLDVEAILAAAGKTKLVVTVEEHSVNGGLGEACASTLLQNGITVPFRIIGFPDEDTVTGAQADIFRHYGISMEGLSQAALTLMK